MVGRITEIVVSSGAALASIAAAAPDDARAEMVRAFDAVLTGMAYAGGGPLLLRHRLGGVRADGRRSAEGENRGRARNAVAYGGGGTGGGAPGQGHRRRAFNSRIIGPSPARRIEQERRRTNMKATLPNLKKLARSTQDPDGRQLRTPSTRKH